MPPLQLLGLVLFCTGPRCQGSLQSTLPCRVPEHLLQRSLISIPPCLEYLCPRLSLMHLWSREVSQLGPRPQVRPLRLLGQSHPLGDPE